MNLFWWMRVFTNSTKIQSLSPDQNKQKIKFNLRPCFKPCLKILLQIKKVNGKSTERPSEALPKANAYALATSSRQLTTKIFAITPPSNSKKPSKRNVSNNGTLQCYPKLRQVSKPMPQKFRLVPKGGEKALAAAPFLLQRRNCSDVPGFQILLSRQGSHLHVPKHRRTSLAYQSRTHKN